MFLHTYHMLRKNGKVLFRASSRNVSGVAVSILIYLHYYPGNSPKEFVALSIFLAFGLDNQLHWHFKSTIKHS